MALRVRWHLGGSSLPEAVCITLIRASIKANCRTLSQAWIAHARRRIGARARHAANSAGLPMLPSQRIGIAIGGLGGSIQAFGIRPGFSSDTGRFRDRRSERSRVRLWRAFSTQKRAPQARRPSTTEPGVGGSRPAREVTLPLVSRPSALRPRFRSGSGAVSAPRGLHV
jgi:hypothetical protein